MLNSTSIQNCPYCYLEYISVAVMKCPRHSECFINSSKTFHNLCSLLGVNLFFSLSLSFQLKKLDIAWTSEKHSCNVTAHHNLILSFPSFYCCCLLYVCAGKSNAGFAGGQSHAACWLRRSIRSRGRRKLAVRSRNWGSNVTVQNSAHGKWCPSFSLPKGGCSIAFLLNLNRNRKTLLFFRSTHGAECTVT